MEVDPTQPAVLPAAPVPLVSSDQSIPQATLTAIKSTLDTESGFREALLATAKEMLRHAQQGSHALHAGSSAGASESLTASMSGYAELAAQCAKNVELTRYTRGHGLIQSACTECVSAGCFQHFLEKGKLKPMGDFPGATDAEYLSGAIQFCQELGRYAVGRATVGDASSVLLCKNLVESVFEQLLQFDFRNGPLRRKYDGVKYAVKRLEDVLYELSLTGLYVADPANAKAPVQPDPKKRKVEAVTPAAAEPAAAAAAAPDPNALIHQPDFDRIRTEMERYDAKREDVIKRCRDVQKISKLAIYGLHRGQTAKVDKQLAQAIELSNGIHNDLIQNDPELRNGSYTNALEEFAEAVLYKVWLENGSICAMDGAEMAGLLNTKEYLGALVDFTGEVGRYAVTAAARRDQDAVRSSLAAMLAVQEGIFFLGDSARGSLSKKESALKSNIKKCEHLMYELSLVKASGRNVSAAKTEEGAGDD